MFFLYFRSIIRALCSAKEAVKKGIQNETQTTITYSKVKSGGTSKRVVEVKGTSHTNVYTARQKIKSFGDNGGKSTMPTHFTCVKITDSTIRENFLKFKVFIAKVKFLLMSFEIYLEDFEIPKRTHLYLGREFK